MNLLWGSAEKYEIKKTYCTDHQFSLLFRNYKGKAVRAAARKVTRLFFSDCSYGQGIHKQPVCSNYSKFNVLVTKYFLVFRKKMLGLVKRILAI